MFMRRLDIHANRESWGRGIAIYIATPGGTEVGDRPPQAAQPLTFVDVVDPDMLPEPSMRLSMPSAQKLMDELWSCGIRPTEGTGSAGSLAATERHLSDMRTIAFGKLELAKP